MGVYTKINKGPISGSAPPSSLGVDTTNANLYVGGDDNTWHLIGAGAGLPAASAAGQVPVSSGAGTTYTAQVPAMTLIQKQTLASPAASVTFSAIPATFTNLLLVVTAASANASVDNLAIQFNGDTGTNYNTQYLTGTGSTASASTVAAGSSGLIGTLPGTNATNAASSTEISIPNYASTVFDKHAVAKSGGLNNGSTIINVLASVQWLSAAAVTSIKLLSGAAANLVVGSTFSLYGLS